MGNNFNWKLLQKGNLTKTSHRKLVDLIYNFSWEYSRICGGDHHWHDSFLEDYLGRSPSHLDRVEERAYSLFKERNLSGDEFRGVLLGMKMLREVSEEEIKNGWIESRNKLRKIGWGELFNDNDQFTK
jgi:hypothetical protein